MFSTRSLAEYSAMNILVNAIWLAPERLRRTSEGSIPEERLKEKQKVRGIFLRKQKEQKTFSPHLFTSLAFSSATSLSSISFYRLMDFNSFTVTLVYIRVITLFIL